MSRFDVIAFDADDTLWHNERLFVDAQAKFKQLLMQYHSPEWIEQRLYAAELRNLPHFGYGIKAFALSMIETAVELTEGRIAGRDIQTIVDAAKAMIAAEVELLDHVADTVAQLADTYALMLITKGDLRDQEAEDRRLRAWPALSLRRDRERQKSRQLYAAARAVQHSATALFDGRQLAALGYSTGA